MKKLVASLFLIAAPLRAAPPAYTPDLEARVFDRAWDLVARHYWDRAKAGESWADARDHFRPIALKAPDRPAFYTILGEMLASLGDSHVYAIDPLQIAIGKARDAGVGACVVRNTGNSLAMGYYPSIAIGDRLIGAA